MKIERAQALDIVARASTFRERLSNRALVPVEDGGAAAQRRLARWRTKAARGDQPLFDEILAAQGLDTDAALRGLGPVRLADDAELPEWIEWLNEGLARAAATSAADEPLSATSILAPFTAAASARLRARVSSATLPDAIRPALEAPLHRMLAAACRSALDMEFAVFRLRGLEQQAPATPESEREFAGHMLGGGLLRFFTEYAVLARAVPAMARNWVDANAEFAARLESDREFIAAEFNAGAPLGAVTAVDAGLSDPHHRGRMVMSVSFACGLRLLYKPKPIDTEAAYARLIDWINERSAGLRLTAVKALARDGYGWVEFVRHAHCSNEDEVRRFYHRCGMLLALFYVTGATDVHAENLIAAGEHPAKIDAETLITPDLGDRAGFDEVAGTAEVRAVRMGTRSVLRSGMLPWRRISGDASADPSALGARIGLDLENPLTGAAPMAEKHLPFPDPARRDLGAYAEDFVAGLREAYTLFAAHRGELAAGPLQRLAASPMRLIFRDTMIYFSILYGSLDSRCTRDGADRSVELESLSLLMGISRPRDRYLPFVESERRAIEGLDIPMFTVAPLDRDLVDGHGERTPGYFPRGCFESVKETLAALGPADLAVQERYIRDSFACKRASMILTGMLTATPETSPAAAAVWNSRTALDAAAAIGQDFTRRAVVGDDGGMIWEGATWSPAHWCFMSGITPGKFGEGLGDVVLMAAALERSGTAGPWRELIRGSLHTLVRGMRSLSERSGERNSQTAPLSFASLVWPLARAASLTGDGDTLDAARRACAFITPVALAADQQLNLAGGTSGFLLGALELGDLDTAIRCGDHLLARRPNWPCPKGMPQLGFASGMAGVALALTHLAARTGLDRFLDAAKAAFQHEWKRRQSEPSDAGWGGGWAGLGLASLALRPHAEEASPAFERALEAVMQDQDVSLDSIHSGLLGRAEFLASAADALDRPDLLERARSLAAWSIERASRRGGYALIPGADPSVWAPGLFFGAAGVAYVLARLANPGAIPAIASWRSA